MLSELHKVDFAAVGLEKYGRAGNYYARQMDRLYSISKAQGLVTDDHGSTVGDLDGLEEMMVWFEQHKVDDEISLMHGDFKTDNIVFHPETNQVIGILDWELSTIGNPLADLANLLMVWYIPPPIGLRDSKRPLVIPEASELIMLYCQLKGRAYPIRGWDFCIAFAFFRMAVILQGVAARIKRNQASSNYASSVAKLVQPCCQVVHEIINAGKLTSHM